VLFVVAAFTVKKLVPPAFRMRELLMVVLPGCSGSFSLGGIKV
jgi:hypothetical protein